jgi:hypothetical protein
MIVLADETLETFFDHEFADSFKLTEKVTEQQQSLGREIFNNLLATGTKLAASTTGVVGSRRLKSDSISTSQVEETIDAIEQTKLEDNIKQEMEEEEENLAPTSSPVVVVPVKKDEHVIGNDSEDDEEEEEEDLTPDVLEEVDRLLKEYGDEDDE